MNINYELYRTFYTVAKLGSITKASEELNISQPAISKAIKNLEESLNGQLFVRTKRGVVLTSEGKEFYNYIKQAIEFINNAENKFTELVNLESGTIRIGCNTTLTREFLLPYLKKFHSLYPKIKIQILTNITSELITKLRNGLIDMVVLNLNNKDYGEDIKIIKCKTVHDCFVVNKSFKSLLKHKITPAELSNLPLLLPAKGSNNRALLDEYAKKNGIILNPSIELTSYSLINEFTTMGFGVGYATKEFISDYLKNKEFFELMLKEPMPSRFIGIALAKHIEPNFSTAKLIELISKK